MKRQGKGRKVDIEGRSLPGDGKLLYQSVRDRFRYVLNIRNTLTNKSEATSYINNFSKRISFYKPFILQKDKRAVQARYYSYLSQYRMIRLNQQEAAQLKYMALYNHNEMLKYAKEVVVTEKQNKRYIDKRVLPLYYYPKKIQNMAFEINKRPISPVPSEEEPYSILRDFQSFFHKNLNQIRKKNLKFNILTKNKANSKKSRQAKKNAQDGSLVCMEGSSISIRTSYRINSRKNINRMDPYMLHQFGTGTVINTKTSLPDKNYMNSSVLTNKIKRKILTEVDNNLSKVKLKESLGRFFKSRISLEQSVCQEKKKKEAPKPAYVKLNCPTININDNLKSYTCKTRTSSMTMKHTVKDYKGLFKTGKLRNNFFNNTSFV